MASFKTQRMAEDIKRELSAIIRSLKDERITTMLSVIKVVVSGDLSFAKIYVSDIGGSEKTALAVEGLDHAKGFIRMRLADSLHIRKAPDLSFIVDDSLEYSSHINSILEKLNRG